MDAPLWLWIGFNLFVLAMIFLDLFFHRKTKQIEIKGALFFSGVWIALALLFNYGIFLYQGEEQALNFLAGYLIEKALSVDNLFVFLLIFESFQTPRQYQHRVLFWGILGALIMRAFFIFFGLALVNALHWVLYIFGVFLVYAGMKMAMPKREGAKHLFVLKGIKKWIPLSEEEAGGRFFVYRRGNWLATPLFLALICIEVTDLVFALDSIPAVMAITRVPFIVYTSNVFAILGLRSLYFALAGLMPYFHFLHYGLAAILTFVGLKMVLEPFFTIPIFYALGFIAAAIALSIGASLLYTPRPR